jgi:hypothetical protein
LFADDHCRIFKIHFTKRARSFGSSCFPDAMVWQGAASYRPKVVRDERNKPTKSRTLFGSFATTPNERRNESDFELSKHVPGNVVEPDTGHARL